MTNKELENISNKIEPKNDKKNFENFDNGLLDTNSHILTKKPINNQSNIKENFTLIPYNKQIKIAKAECEFYVLNQANKAYDNLESFEYKQAIQTMELVVIKIIFLFLFYKL